jgi:hypothetical protein
LILSTTYTKKIGYENCAYKCFPSPILAAFSMYMHNGISLQMKNSDEIILLESNLCPSVSPE